MICAIRSSPTHRRAPRAARLPKTDCAPDRPRAGHRLMPRRRRVPATHAPPGFSVLLSACGPETVATDLHLHRPNVATELAARLRSWTHALTDRDRPLSDLDRLVGDAPGPSQADSG